MTIERSAVALPKADQVLANENLPLTYTAAQQSLAKCTRVDECKDWSDKAAALAAYARMAKDESLYSMARKIQARAIRRLGEISKDLPKAKPLNGKGAGLPDSGKTKAQVLKDAGISTSAAHRAERVADIPQDEFERHVESVTPPTATQLASRGVPSRDPWPATTSIESARQVIAALRGLAEQLPSVDPVLAAGLLKQSEIGAVRQQIADVVAWVARLEVQMGRQLDSIISSSLSNANGRVPYSNAPGGV